MTSLLSIEVDDAVHVVIVECADGAHSEPQGLTGKIKVLRDMACVEIDVAVDPLAVFPLPRAMSADQMKVTGRRG
jgi:hypothetical protein